MNNKYSLVITNHGDKRVYHEGDMVTLWYKRPTKEPAEYVAGKGRIKDIDFNCITLDESREHYAKTTLIPISCIHSGYSSQYLVDSPMDIKIIINSVDFLEADKIYQITTTKGFKTIGRPAFRGECHSWKDGSDFVFDCSKRCMSNYLCIPIDSIAEIEEIDETFDEMRERIDTRRIYEGTFRGYKASNLERN